MVTKGVLKDHLLLLGNSMTCSGNLIGFNTGGIKAVSKTLNVQVPFTEATLFVRILLLTILISNTLVYLYIHIFYVDELCFLIILLHRPQRNASKRLLRNATWILCRALLLRVLGANMLLLVQVLHLKFYWTQERYFVLDS